jgi:hypothetical protein
VLEMSTNKGAHRIHLLAKRIMLLGSLAGIALWILMSVLQSGARRHRDQWRGDLGWPHCSSSYHFPSHVALSFGLSHGLWKVL